MRLIPLLLLTACGRLGPFAEYRDSADTGADTGVDTADDTDTDTGPVDTDTGPADTGTPPPTRDGVYDGTFSMEVTIGGIFPIDGCVGDAQIVVSGSSASGAFDCPFEGLIGQTLGSQTGEITATVSGGVVTDPYATMGLVFVFDELSGSFSGTTGIVLSEAGTVSLDGLGDYDYTVEFDVRK